MRGKRAETTLPPELAIRLDAWCLSQEVPPTPSAALRHMVERYLVLAERVEEERAK